MLIDVTDEVYTILSPFLASLIAERAKARELKDWKTADKLRQDLRKLGIELKDLRNGPVPKINIKAKWFYFKDDNGRDKPQNNLT